MPLNVTAIRSRLFALIEQGAKLPLAGMSRATREKFRALRAVLAVERYLQGEPLADIRRSLVISKRRWREYWTGFRRTVDLGEEALEKLSYPEEMITGWLSTWAALKEEAQAKRIIEQDPLWPWEAEESFQSQSGFMKLLSKRHRFSPAVCEEFCQSLGEMAKKLSGPTREPGQIVYIGVASSEGPGKSLQESRLKAVMLDYLRPEDWRIARRTSPAELKWTRIERFATQAYAQGAALGVHDF